MAETTIHTLKADVILDTEGLRRGANLSQAELNKLRSTFRRLQTDEERQAKSLDLLEKAYRDGTITARQFEAAQQRLARSIRRTGAQARTAQGQFAGLSQFLPGAGLAGRFAGVGMGAGAVGAAAIGGGLALKGAQELAELTVRQSAYAVELADTADKLGATAAGLRGLQLAAEITGVDARTTAMGLQRMTRRIAEAAQGTGEAQGALRELGLDATRLARLRPEDQFLAIADAMRNVDQAGDQLRLSFKLFDSEGAALVNTLRMGRAELEQYRDRFGNLIDQELIDNSRQLQEQLSELKIVAGDAALVVADKLIPAVAGFLQLAVDTANLEAPEPGSTGRAVRDSLIESIGNFLRPGGGTLARRLLGGPDTFEVQPAIQEQVQRQGARRRARELTEFLQRSLASGVGAFAGGLGQLGGSAAGAAGPLGGMLPRAERGLRDALEAEIERRREHLGQFQDTARQQISFQKSFNRQLEQNLLAPDLTRQDAVQLEAEAIARQRFGAQAFDVQATEKMLAEETKRLTTEIKNLVKALKDPRRLNPGGGLDILPSLEALLNG